MANKILMPALVTFSDVAAYFTQDEWQLLEERQKEFYKNVMEGIHSVLIGLGHTIVNSDVLFRVKEEPFHHKELQNSVRTDCSRNIPERQLDIKPDILLRLQCDQIPMYKAEEEAKPRSNYDQIDARNSVSVRSPTIQIPLCKAEKDAPPFPAHEPVAISIPEVNNHGKILQCQKSEASETQASITNELCVHSGKLTNRQSRVDTGRSPQSLLNQNTDTSKGCSILYSLIMQQDTQHPSLLNAADLRTSKKGCLSLQHNAERPFKCALCSKAFCDKSGLAKHRKTHTGGKTFPCTHCKKIFTQKWNLVQHQRTHTGERPYECMDCHKSFMYNSVLIKHRRIHTGERPYHCTQCEKKFTGYSGLVRHEKTHLHLKLHTCTECGESFSQKHYLIKHQGVHLLKLPFAAVKYYQH
ncbi:zinc finger protein 182 isoform X2 [Xenopus laevis]|nr:zinc finger protein 182 isoform X2 [Xenopus laevis]